MSRYNATEDPLCYPGSQVHIDRADPRDQDDLDQFEQLMFLSRSEEPWPEGALNNAHDKKIHHHLFRDIYG